jgi:hypothetical protein
MPSLDLHELKEKHLDISFACPILRQTKFLGRENTVATDALVFEPSVTWLLHGLESGYGNLARKRLDGLLLHCWHFRHDSSDVLFYDSSSPSGNTT